MNNIVLVEPDKKSWFHIHTGVRNSKHSEERIIISCEVKHYGNPLYFNRWQRENQDISLQSSIADATIRRTWSLSSPSPRLQVSALRPSETSGI